MMEVLIAMLLIALGLLGYALLQTTNLRFTQSANYRTVATNLAYDLLDQMRANRLSVEQYGSIASFASGSVSATGACARPTATVTVEENVGRWQCDVVKALGDQASAAVSYADGVANVSITWGERLQAEESTTFQVETRL